MPGKLVHKHKHQSFGLPDQMMHVVHTDAHTTFCIMWSNDACSCEACYIHPAVPYIILQPSILCDSSFDALQAHFLLVYVSNTALFSNEIWIQRHPLCLGDHHLLWNIEAGAIHRRSLFTSHHSLQSFLIKAAVSEFLSYSCSCCQFVICDVLLVWNGETLDARQMQGRLNINTLFGVVSHLFIISVHWSKCCLASIRKCFQGYIKLRSSNPK